MAEIEQALEKRVGPLPLVAWAGIALVGVGLGLYLRKSFGSTATGNAGNVDGVDTTSEGGTNLNTAGNLAAYSSDGTTTSSPGVSQSIDTNDDWRTYVERILIGKGYDAATVDSAIGKYLTGAGLSSQEYNIVDQGIIDGGPTPEYVPAATQIAAATSGNDASNGIAQPTVTQTAAQLADAAIANLPKINSADWAVNLGSNADITQTGVGGPGGIYTGHNVGNGAPVYALINGSWVQDFNWKTLAPGTKIGTPTQLSQDVYSDTINTTF